MAVIPFYYSTVTEDIYETPLEAHREEVAIKRIRAHREEQLKGKLQNKEMEERRQRIIANCDAQIQQIANILGMSVDDLKQSAVIFTRR